MLFKSGVEQGSVDQWGRQDPRRFYSPPRRGAVAKSPQESGFEEVREELQAEMAQLFETGYQERQHFQ